MTVDDRADRLAAVHRVLVDQVERLVTSQDWTRFLVQSRRFHTYSPINQTLLVGQLAERGIDPADGYVASYTTWRRQPAVDGTTCQVRRGEQALWVYAPITHKRDRTAPDAVDGEDVVRVVRGFKPVAVFHQCQLTSPPALAAAPRPQLLTGPDGSDPVWHAVVDEVTARGFRVDLSPRPAGVTWNGQTVFTTSTVTVHDDLALPQRCKTLLHEWAHIHLDHRGALTDQARHVAEVEAESSAYLVADTVGIDAATYTIPYIAGWAGTAGTDLILATANRVLRAAAIMIDRLGQRLGIVLDPDPINRDPRARHRDNSVERDTFTEVGPGRDNSPTSAIEPLNAQRLPVPTLSR